MWGWFNADAIRASRRKRSRRWASRANSGGRIQGLRIDFGGGQHLEEILRIESAGHAFRLRAALQRLLLAEQADDQAADGAEVGRAVTVLLASGVLVEAHIEHPVLTILDAPMATDGVAQRPGARAQVADEHPRLPCLLLAFGHA